ncbi:Ferric reductase like transmembrane component [Saccharopolyspora kobensis]|uniref:Ferric reductase like transmembrane component n=1 Tax=Saccharopolyspora kobensis TaxID=146035 RepID=A0A1H6DC73_9PSEU|nr:ferric reductase-like transmembrane domain-containing protein [Saccharopolyspora kobensis]SEG82413.1 Ferric reductase like transmembrane component [Saccharopolyspora kobensis]SFE24450.1 Ferric reductase like transmembrane component [Saccharopolyspora kobensis]
MTSSPAQPASEPADDRVAGAGGRRRPTLRSDLRASIPDGLIAVAVTGAVFALIYARILAGTSSTLSVMPFMADAEKFWMYFLSQAFGWSALLWAWITVVLGLLLSGPRPSWAPLSGQRLERLHRTTSLNTIALIAAHALLFAAELVRADTAGWFAALATAFVETFVPGGYDSGTGKIAIPIGQAALYLAIPLGLLFYVRHRIGPKTWRVLHRFVIAVYVLSVWHTLLYGTNVWYDGWFRTTIWLLQLPIAALLLVRLLRPARRSEKLLGPRAHTGSSTGWALRLSGRLGIVGVIAALIGVIISGADGGRTAPPEDTSSSHVHD